MDKAALWRKSMRELISDYKGNPERAKDICAELLARLNSIPPGTMKEQRQKWIEPFGYLNELGEMKLALMFHDWCGACDSLVNLFWCRPAEEEPIRNALIGLLEHYLTEDVADESSKPAATPV